MEIRHQARVICTGLAGLRSALTLLMHPAACRQRATPAGFNIYPPYLKHAAFLVSSFCCNASFMDCAIPDTDLTQSYCVVSAVLMINSKWRFRLQTNIGGVVPGILAPYSAAETIWLSFKHKRRLICKRRLRLYGKLTMPRPMFWDGYLKILSWCNSVSVHRGGGGHPTSYCRESQSF